MLCDVCVQNFVLNFKWYLWNFTQNFKPILRKICILLAFICVWFTISLNYDLISLSKTVPSLPYGRVAVLQNTCLCIWRPISILQLSSLSFHILCRVMMGPAMISICLLFFITVTGCFFIEIFNLHSLQYITNHIIWCLDHTVKIWYIIDC